jgi:hypothetical protein
MDHQQRVRMVMIVPWHASGRICDQMSPQLQPITRISDTWLLTAMQLLVAAM